MMRKMFYSSSRGLLVTLVLFITVIAVGCGGGGDNGNNNTLPVVQVTLPVTNGNYNLGDDIEFRGNCTDSEDGALTGLSLVWVSSLDGQIGTGENFTSNALSAGDHLITLTATDSAGGEGTDSVNITINAITNSRPVASIILPVSGNTFNIGGTITFIGSCNDAEDGNLTGTALVWTSDRDGQIGTGETFSISTLSVGTHQITVTGTDSGGLAGTATINITINTAPNSRPVAQIIQPSEGNTFNENENIVFYGVCNDNEDGSLTGSSLVWVSSRDGQIGTGVQFNSSALSAGAHQITLAGTDSGGAVGTDTVNININASPVASINSPTDGSSFNAIDTIVFNGTGSDAEDGPLSGASLTWASDVDGLIGTGSNFSISTLSRGTHLISLTANDSRGAESEDTILVMIEGKVPDTNQIRDYTGTFGEDSDYTINPPTYTKLDSSGRPLPFSATDWVMVRDDVTGLIWEIKTWYDGSIHDRGNRYNWQDSLNVFIAQLNSDNFGGYSDWRIPTAIELFSLMYLEYYSPDIGQTDRAYFPNTVDRNYWTYSSEAGNIENIWQIDFLRGTTVTSPDSGLSYVRAVRGGQTTPALVNNYDGTVTDANTGLVWQQAEGGLMTWLEALAYCETLALAGYDDWRLPNSKELQSIVDFSASDPAINTVLFPGAQGSFYWSSTTSIGNIGVRNGVDFLNGEVDVQAADLPLGSGNYTSFYVRAVRGGQ